jgi:DNA-binding NarL/FixJ family response regulator
MVTQPRYRLVLADDHDDILEELRHLLAADFDVVSTVNDGLALLDAVTELKPDAVICDLYMPGANGIESGARILRKGLCGAVIVLTMYNEPHLVTRAFQEGIQGYVLKEDASEELTAAVLAVMRGEKYLSQGLGAQPTVPQGQRLRGILQF